MPHIETLKVLQTSNTSPGIFETMALLLDLSKAIHRVSFVRDRYAARLSVGDSLDVDSPTSSTDSCPARSRPRKKRWWEQKKETGQLRLPFSLYEPAQIIYAAYDASRHRMHLKLMFTDGDGVEKTIDLYDDGHRPLTGNGLKAIRVHKVVKKWVEPTEESAREVEAETLPLSFAAFRSQTPGAEPQSNSNLSQRDCAELVERAMGHGIAVSPIATVYDDVTGEYIGSDFQVTETVAHSWRDRPGSRQRSRPRCQCISFIALDGRPVRHQLNSSRIRFVDRRFLSATDCRSMMDSAMRNGVVVTPAGKAYDAESGLFLGPSLQLTSDPTVTRFGDSSYSRHLGSRTVHGELLMPNGQRWSFQTYASNVTHIDREVFAAPTSSIRERRHTRIQERRQRDAEFARYYGGNGDTSQDEVSLGNGSFNIRGTQSSRESGE